MEKSGIKNYSFFGLPVSALTYRSVRLWVNETIRNKKKRTIYGFSLYSIYGLKKIPEIFTLGSKADIFFTDGRPFFWLCKIYKVPVIEGISIPQFVMEVMKIANSLNYSVMLIGATDEINKKAIQKIKKVYPGISNVTGINGYFPDEKSDEVMLAIKNVQPDILLVGMSSPKKEKFVFNNLSKIEANLIIPCGGMIDVLAGKTKMTPFWVKNIGCAFLFRILQEPRRLFFDRLKMLIFLFSNFFPRLIIMKIADHYHFSIPQYCIK